jgi:flavin-dependent dehydrogenase
VSHDAIVVGARCAGASTAMLLARAGLRVLLVDRAAAGSDIPHGHFIHQHGPRRLVGWGLLDRLLEVAPPVTELTSELRDFPLHAADLSVGVVPMGVGPRRSDLDRILVEAAVEAGAEYRERFPVDGFLTDGDRIVGIRSRAVEERAPLVIGADGRNSSLAKAVDAPVTRSAPTQTCWYASYFSGIAGRGLELHGMSDRVVFAFPTGGGLHCLMVAAPIAELPRARRDIEAHVLAATDRVAGLGERVREGRREERWFGAAQLPNFMRRPWGDGWALVGDAGVHKDPLMALGICDALRDAELLADAVVAGEPLSEYERRRDEATTPDYFANLHMAAFRPLPQEFADQRAAVRGDPVATRNLLLATQGMG